MPVLNFFEMIFWTLFLSARKKGFVFNSIDRVDGSVGILFFLKN